jgi:DNA-binding CsgD family transcriptional regulator
VAGTRRLYARRLKEKDTSDNLLKPRTAKPRTPRKWLNAFEVRLYPCCFGLALVCCWDYGIQRFLSSGIGDLAQTMHFFGLAASCLVLMVLAMAGKRSFSSSRLLLFAMPAAAIACVVLLAFAQNTSLQPGIQFAVRLVTGVCSGWLYVLWGLFYRGLSIKQTIVLLFSSVIIASALKAILALADSLLISACAYVILPVLATVSWHLAVKGQPAAAGATGRYTKKSLWVFKNPLIGIAVFSFVIGILLGMDAGFFTLSIGEQLFTHVLVVAVCALLMVLAHCNSEYFEFSSAWLLVLLTITTGLMVAGLVGGSAGALALAIVAAAQRFVAVFIWLALSDIAHNSDFMTDAVFGLGKGLYALFVALGLLLSSVLELSFGDMRLSLLVVYVLMLALFFFMRDKTAHSLRLFGDLSPSVATERIGQLDEQVGLLAARYGFSEREKEIVILYAQGRSRSFISAQLFISENTVRDHIRNVYRKMGIHNKQTLIDTIQKR